MRKVLSSVLVFLLKTTLCWYNQTVLQSAINTDYIVFYLRRVERKKK